MPHTDGIDIAWLSQQFPALSRLVPLNAGGQKQVFSAEHKSDGPVVLKVIHPHQDIETTRREIVAAGHLTGQRVPEIFEADLLTTHLGACVWFRERRIDGNSVRTLVGNGAFDKVALLKLGFQILEILVAAEQLRIVHRDVKPENILCDTATNFWLIDFGVARHLNLNSLTATGPYFGKFTPGYAPPEQFQNRKMDIDARCDLFALGVTLYECATGTNPYLVGARDALEVARRVQGSSLPRLQLSFTSASDFADLVSAMTQPRRDHRPATAQEAFDWIKQICHREGI
jgi:serine/threonine-protein kinase